MRYFALSSSSPPFCGASRNVQFFSQPLANCTWVLFSFILVLFQRRFSSSFLNLLPGTYSCFTFVFHLLHRVLWSSCYRGLGLVVLQSSPHRRHHNRWCRLPLSPGRHHCDEWTNELVGMYDSCLALSLDDIAVSRRPRRRRRHYYEEESVSSFLAFFFFLSSPWRASVASVQHCFKYPFLRLLNILPFSNRSFFFSQDQL